MEENTSTENTENTEVTTESTGAETQQAETQSSEQADTTQNEGTVTESMGIQESTETSETVEESQPTLDDIVTEALAGELSEETQKLVDQNGLGKHLDMLVQGHKAIQEKNNQEVFSVVGGEKSYGELQEWGKNNMSQEQQQAFNEALFSGNMNLAKLAVQGLQAQYVQANGKSPDRVIEGGGTSNAENRPFSNVNEYINETRSFKYKSDPEYARQVEAKRNKSGF